jgi:hypothetical protein
MILSGVWKQQGQQCRLSGGNNIEEQQLQLWLVTLRATVVSGVILTRWAVEQDLAIGLAAARLHLFLLSFSA